MGLIKESWKGEKPLSTVFWVYYVAFLIAYKISLLLVFSVLPENLKPFVIIPGILFLFTYAIWVYVSIWRCAKNSAPVWKVLARAWIIISVIGVGAKFIENYQYYLERAKTDASSQTTPN